MTIVKFLQLLSKHSDNMCIKFQPDWIENDSLATVQTVEVLVGPPCIDISLCVKLVDSMNLAAVRL